MGDIEICIGCILCVPVKNGTLYVGVTNDIVRRTYEHKQGVVKGFTKRYNVTKLVYTEQFANIAEAIAREKCIKSWKRQWKMELIESINREWQDLLV